MTDQTLDQMHYDYQQKHLDKETMLLNIYRYVQDRCKDEDIRQSVVLSAIESLETINGQLSHWLSARIKGARLLKYASRVRDLKRHSDIDPSTVVLPSNPASFADLSTLPEKIRTIAELMVQGMTLDDIADRLNVSVSTIKMRLKRYRDVTFSPIVLRN